MKKCFNWVVRLRVVCPYCLEVNDYDEFTDKTKGEKGEIIKCRKCNKRFLLDEDEGETKMTNQECEIEYEKCPTCKGTGLKPEPDGNYDLDDPCDDCCGSGKVEKEE